ncbi:MAG TPA: hypothetical protein VFY79_01475 [Dehalococcoidia bacterium]|jgi:hypothetical protein|nr:hypothetical protein [Dehalococcoidia bacterium]
MPVQTVVYVDKRGSNTGSFTRRLEAVAQEIENQNLEIVGVVPNAGLNETLGIWIFARQRS